MKIHTIPHEDVTTEILALGQLCHGEDDIGRVLELLVEKIANILKTDVCSLYMLNHMTQELVLSATKGLNRDAIGTVRMKVGEGLVGMTMEWLKPISMATGRRSKKFKYFPGTGEERYASFLSVPLIYNRKPIGVLVVQNIKPVKFSSQTVHLMMTLAIPAVNVIEKAKLLGTFGTLSQKDDTKKIGPELLKRSKGAMHVGIGSSPGIAMAGVKTLHRPVQHMAITEQNNLSPDVEKMRLMEAFRWVEEEVRETIAKAKKKFGLEEMSIFDAYQMVLESAAFKDEILNEIDKGHSALKAVEIIIRKYTETMAMAEDEYIRERAYDIHDVGRKITDRLIYGSHMPSEAFAPNEPCILMADFWSISDFVEMDPQITKAIISPSGGASSHVAILAKSIGIPAVMGLSTFIENIREGDKLIVDGTSGVVIVNPEPETQRLYQKEMLSSQKAQQLYLKTARKPSKSMGGKRIMVGANMGMISHIEEAQKSGAEEIGLYRTELPFLIRKTLPTEDEQYLLYSKVLKAMDGRPVTFRTLDIGGDKYVPYLQLPHEANPFLGWRSIRISLDREDLFRIQLRALLRASVHGPTRLMFPMISSVDEIRKVKDILRDVKKELLSQKKKIDRNVPIGIMVEVPAAVVIAESLIREVNFFSIGTNDLVQYVLAVDRNNAKVAKLYNSLHPAVLNMIAQTVKIASKHGKSVTICGEMASHPLSVAFLTGIGIPGLSMSVPLIAKIKYLVNRLDAKKLKKLSKKALHAATASEVTQIFVTYFKNEGLEEFLPQSKMPEITSF
ncbi:phosphoenolpyruvate--protein phosphotransferase [bacterium]|nr:phosphoenolpyruvate--protein phosphotransferase [bacterium]